MLESEEKNLPTKIPEGHLMASDWFSMVYFSISGRKINYLQHSNISDGVIKKLGVRISGLVRSGHVNELNFRLDRVTADVSRVSDSRDDREPVIREFSIFSHDAMSGCQYQPLVYYTATAYVLVVRLDGDLVRELAVLC